MAGARARIADTIAVPEPVPPNALDRAADDPLAHNLPGGMVFDLIATGYAPDRATAQFHFHLAAACAIPRHEGVMPGKIDCIPPLLRHPRPAGALPA